MPLRVPFLDLKAHYTAIRMEILDACASVVDDQSFILGPQVRSFEEAVGKYLGVGHAVGVASGSDALLLSLMALGVGPGDDVLTTPYTFFATAGSIWRLGARPVFVDIDPATFNISPDLIAGALTEKTKAVIPVHLYGQSADMEPILAAAGKRGIPVVEDAAQAIGALYRGRKAGTLGDLGCFSFYPTKNLGGIGDGGLVVTGREDLASRVSLLRVHGSSRRYLHEIVGCNSRLDSIQAAALGVGLRHLEGWTEARRKNAERYGEMFRARGLGEAVVLPAVMKDSVHVFNQYVVRVPRRDDLRRYLQEQGIGTEVYYPIPLHLQPCFAGLGYGAGDLPESERAALETLALPIYPELTEEMQEAVVGAVARFVSSR